MRTVRCADACRAAVDIGVGRFVCLFVCLFAVAQVKVDRMAPAPKVARDSKFARIAFGSNSAQVQRSAAMHSLRCP